MEFVYYTTVNKSTGETPLHLVFREEAVDNINQLIFKAQDAELPKHEYTQLLDKTIS